MNEIELARVVDMVASIAAEHSQGPTVYADATLTERECRLANVELRRRGSTGVIVRAPFELNGLSISPGGEAAVVRPAGPQLAQ